MCLGDRVINFLSITVFLGSENGENFELDDSSEDEDSDTAGNITVVSRRSRSSRKSRNTSGEQRESIVEQIRNQKVQIVGKKDSVVSHDREVML